MKYGHKYICDRCGISMSKESLICTLIFAYKKNGKCERHYCYPCSCKIAEAIEKEECRK